MANDEQVATSISPLLQWVATLESCAAMDREQLVKLEEAEKETETCVSELKVSLLPLSPSLDSSKVTWHGHGKGTGAGSAGKGVGDRGRDPRHGQGNRGVLAGKGPKGKAKGTVGPRGQAGRVMGARGGRAERREGGGGRGAPAAGRAAGAVHPPRHPTNAGAPHPQ